MPPLRAGAAFLDITPQPGIQIDGDIGRPRPVEKIADPIYAKALVLDNGRTKLCILSLDSLAIQNAPADEIRDRIAHELGFDRDAVMVHVTQNHSAPGIGRFLCRDSCTLIPPEHAWLRMGDDRYYPWAIERAVEAARAADGELREAKIGAASGLDPRAAFNRRFVLRDGTTMANPWSRRSEILHAEGPSDPEVGVVSIVSPAGTLALLLHHTSHPTHGYPTRTVSADWPGTWSEAMKGVVGPRCVPMVLNGCCGNTIHINWADPYWVSDQERMGRQLAETASECLTRIEHAGEVELDYRTVRIQIPYRDFDPGQLEAAQKLIAEHPAPMWRKDEPDCVEWDWLYAVGRLDLADLKRTQTHYHYEIQAFRINDIAILALIGEPFVEGQLNIKLRSPVRHTYIAHMSNGYVGYIPTKGAFKGGGYETWTGNWSKLVHEALDMICDASVKLLEELFAVKTPNAVAETAVTGFRG